MGKPRKSKKVKLRVKQSAALVHKNDKTRVSRPDTLNMNRIQGRPPATVAPVFKVKLRKK